MLLIALVLFAAAAVGGLVLAIRVFQGESLPMPVTVLHGLLAATGLVLVVLAYVQTTETAGLGWALGLLVIAALGGFFLVSFNLRGQATPRSATVIHALAAVAGVALLALAVL
ncbi:MAG: hypothetical protein MPN21_06255 [Thermoanaerobaculia bacterium]|nr:hypothetical protein [Thermoanaerobaculia bacterium]